MDYPLAEGDLMAFIEGEDLPHVAAALRASPELQRELDQLRAVHTAFGHAFGGIARPDPQDLVDVATNQATSQQQLRVAAYVRESAAGRAELESLQQTFQATTSQPTSRRFARAALLTLLPSGAPLGTRSSGTRTDQAFTATAIDVQVTLHLRGPEREQWRLEGQITQAYQPVPEVVVRVRGVGTRARRTTTDAMGFFAVERLSAGTYRVEVALSEHLLVIPEVQLHDD